MKKTITSGILAMLAVMMTSSCRTTPPPTMGVASLEQEVSRNALDICREFSKSPKQNRMTQAEKLKSLFELDQRKLIFTIKSALGQKKPVTESTISSLLGEPDYRQQNDHGYWVVYTIGKDSKKRTMLVFDFIDEKLSDVQQFAFPTA